MTRDQTLQEYLTVCETAQAAHERLRGTPEFPGYGGIGVLGGTERGRRIAKLMLALCAKNTRAALRQAPRPTDDQALAIAVNLMDQGWPIEDEEEVILAWALARSKMTLRDIALAAGL